MVGKKWGIEECYLQKDESRIFRPKCLSLGTIAGEWELTKSLGVEFLCAREFISKLISSSTILIKWMEIYRQVLSHKHHGCTCGAVVFSCGSNNQDNGLWNRNPMEMKTHGIRVEKSVCVCRCVGEGFLHIRSKGRERLQAAWF